ncbi:hypothetical protein DL93DRAFT_2074688 [Clavulina sp. PMI_390]|nr:hypothetical protein DL93DRAFT_2074688 [Clavulina sp. PMI_390]
MPPLAQTIPREEGDPDDSDEDILVGGATQGFKDPISLTVFVDPVTSTKCPHSFSRETIYAMFNQPTITCPAHGCRAQLTKADLVRNKNLENRVKAHLRREKERAEKEMRDAVDMTIEDSEEE